MSVKAAVALGLGAAGLGLAGCAAAPPGVADPREVRLGAATECRQRFPHVVARVEVDRFDRLRWQAVPTAGPSEREQFLACYRERLGAAPHVATITWPDSAPEPAEAPFLQAPVWRPGDRWRFRLSGRREARTVDFAVRREETVDGDPYYVAAWGSREEYWKRPELSLAVEQGGGRASVRHVPPLLWYVWPLRRGTVWEFESTVERPGGTPGPRRFLACRAEAPATVTVAAGAFQAIAIVCRAKGSDRPVRESWYAPAVRMDVRRRVHRPDGVDDLELLEYRPAAP